MRSEETDAGADREVGAPGSCDGPDDYRVELDVFSGPLDLLLHLIKKEEIDIHDIPISRILDQYMAHLEVLRLMELDEVGDFLVMAANLMLIKSRLLVPQAVDLDVEQEELEDPRTELVHKLLEYRRFKDAAHRLADLRAARARRFPRGEDRDLPPADAPEEPGAIRVELWDLVEVFAQIVREVGLGQGLIPFRDEGRPMHHCMEEILGRLARQGPFELHALFDGVTTRGEVIGYFLAVLELMRTAKVTAVQEVAFGPIRLEAGPGDARAGAAVRSLTRRRFQAMAAGDVLPEEAPGDAT